MRPPIDATSRRARLPAAGPRLHADTTITPAVSLPLPPTPPCHTPPPLSLPFLIAMERSPLCTALLPLFVSTLCSPCCTPPLMHPSPLSMALCMVQILVFSTLRVFVSFAARLVVPLLCWQSVTPVRYGVILVRVMLRPAGATLLPDSQPCSVGLMGLCMPALGSCGSMVVFLMSSFSRCLGAVSQPVALLRTLTARALPAFSSALGAAVRYAAPRHFLLFAMPEVMQVARVMLRPPPRLTVLGVTTMVR